MIRNRIYELKTHPTLKYGRRHVNRIDKIILHHSATTSGTSDAFAKYHVDTNKWPGIGYHFVITKQGMIEQVNELETISYHAAGQNTSAIGICLVGNFDIDVPTQMQLNSLELLIKYLRVLLQRNVPVFGHCDFSTKTCPGKNFNLDFFKSI